MKNENAPDRLATPAEGTAQDPSSRSKRNHNGELPVVFAVLYRAAGTATYDWLLVRCCPFCQHAHRHVRFERDAETIERSPSCAPHRSYRVKVSDIVPARRTRRAA